MTSSFVEGPSFSWCFLGFRRASTDPPSPFTSISRAHFAHSDLHHILADWCAPNYVAVRYKGEPVLSETAPRSAGRPRPAALASLTRRVAPSRLDDGARHPPPAHLGDLRSAAD